MISWILPYFITAVCINGQGVIEPPRIFGPFESEHDAQLAVTFLAYGYLCESRPPYRYWRWTKAIPINIPPDGGQP